MLQAPQCQFIPQITFASYRVPIYTPGWRAAMDKVSCWRTKSARHWRESNPQPFDPESDTFFPPTSKNFPNKFQNGVGVLSWLSDSYSRFLYSLKKIKWIIHSIYGVNRFHSLRSEYHSILTPGEWKFTTQRVKSRPVHSIFTPKEVITDVTKYPIEWIDWFFLLREYMYLNLLLSAHVFN